MEELPQTNRSSAPRTSQFVNFHRQFSSPIAFHSFRFEAVGDSAIQNIARINGVSSHLENLLRELLNRIPGFRCDFPHTAEERVQRSGCPDLRLVQTATNRVFYLDPKLYAAGSRDSNRDIYKPEAIVSRSAK